MIVIGICGASGSGKSTLANRIRESLSCSCVIIGQDGYYKDHSHLPLEEREYVNYDEPDVFDHDALLADVNSLASFLPVTTKGYDYTTHCRADRTDILIEPPEVLILEGIHIFRDRRLCEKMSLKVFMQVDADICLLRRVRRDIKKRGRDIDSIAAQYISTVKPMYEKYVKKYAQFADFMIMRGGKNPLAIDAITAYLTAKLMAERFSKESIREDDPHLEAMQIQEEES